MIYTNIEELIGKTPLVLPERYNRKFCRYGTVFCKMECFNPTGSAKDRAALYMLNDAHAQGMLKSGAIVIEPTSGNTGIGLAALCASKGIRLILTMPDTMSEERRRLLKAYGAQIVLTPGAEGMQGAVNMANKLASEIPNSFIPSQFDNPANPRAHYETTGPEIFSDMGGKIDYFVAGVGTGGTLSGAGAYLKKQNPSCRVFAVEPASSPLLTKGYAGAHGIQGIGANFIPENLDQDVYNDVLAVSDEDARRAARDLAHLEGILIGISAGAALHAATHLANRAETAGKSIVVLLPDSGERYLSTGLFEEE